MASVSGRGPLPPLPKGDGASVSSFKMLKQKQVTTIQKRETNKRNAMNQQMNRMDEMQTLDLKEDDETEEELEDPRPLEPPPRPLLPELYHLVVASASLNFFLFSSSEVSGFSHHCCGS